jgi:hypothetical protein
MYSLDWVDTENVCIGPVGPFRRIHPSTFGRSPAPVTVGDTGCCYAARHIVTIAVAIGRIHRLFVVGGQHTP